MIKYLALMCILPTVIYAQEAITVQSLDETVDLSSLDERFKKSEGLPQSKISSSLPSPSERDNFFKKADLTNELRTYDQLDRDIFFRTVKAYPLEKITPKYPKISKEKISFLKSLLEGTK
jgi:hypothetical protein